VDDWLRVGKGFRQPFGQSHPQVSIDAAKEYGEKMLAELAPFTVNHPGLAAHLTEVAERFEVELEVEAANTYAVFFADVDLVDNWQAATEELQNGITAVIEPWVDEDPLTVVQRLLSLRTELNLGNVAWPDRVWMACNVLSDRVVDPLAWADIALETGFFLKLRRSWIELSLVASSWATSVWRASYQRQRLDGQLYRQFSKQRSLRPITSGF
jgi:hypothetical protein